MKQITSDNDALDLIAYLMSGAEWDADTLEHIAQIVQETGREINGPEEDDESAN